VSNRIVGSVWVDVGVIRSDVSCAPMPPSVRSDHLRVQLERFVRRLGWWWWRRSTGDHHIVDGSVCAIGYNFARRNRETARLVPA
jgi:hypothetical protein